ncbi:lipoprotein [Paenibacillus pabuli]
MRKIIFTCLILTVLTGETNNKFT